MRVFIGMDDTDNLESRGTGYRARQLGERLAALELADVKRISRHQLLVHPEIPYTSHNSSVCLDARVASKDLPALREACREFLLEESAPGSDAGLCVASEDQVSEEVRGFGAAAKTTVLSKAEADELAEYAGLYLEGLTGERIGVIGALAGVGLCAEGNDGRCIWVPGLRELAGGYEARELAAITGIDGIVTLDGKYLPEEERVEVGTWARPVLREGKALLFVEEYDGNDACGWRIIPKETIKQISG